MNTTVAPDTTIRQATQVEARQLSTDALLQWADVLRLDLADNDPDYPGEVGRLLASDRLEVVEAELSRREQLASQAPHIVRANSQAYELWLEVAREAKARVGVPDLFHALVGPIKPAGRNGPRGGVPEFSASCPACGGEDRLRLWGGPNGQAWCRQCGWKADAIALVQSFAPGCSTFREALTWLTGIAATEVA